MNQRELCHTFVNDGTKYAGGSALTISHDKLMSYVTPIAVRQPCEGRDTFAVNPNRYSVTTSKHQTFLKGALAMAGYTDTGEVVDVRNSGMFKSWQEPFTLWERAS